MATRSTIGIEVDGKIVAVSCHWDGYLEHNGEILYRHYQNTQKVLELISLGDMSSLGSEIGEKHDFDEQNRNGWTTYYTRDRGESELDSKQFDSRKDMVEWYWDSEYYYLWCENKWIYSTGKSWHDLLDAIESINAERAE